MLRTRWAAHKSGSPPGSVARMTLHAIISLLHEIWLALFAPLGTMSADMRSLFCLAVIAMAGCSSDPLSGTGHDPLNGHLVDQGRSEAERTNYPPETLKEQTFVLSSPISYESKRGGTSDDIHTAMKLGAKI